MNLETETEKLRTRMGEMAAEIERLQSVIDGANAQVVRAENAPRVATSDKVLFNGSHGHAGYVIEEQQSPAVTVPDCCDNCKRIKYPIATLRYILNLEQDSSKTLSDTVTDIINKYAAYPPIESSDAMVARAAIKKLAELDIEKFNESFIAQSPRITEQDAREIAVAYALHRGTEYNKGYAEMFVDQFFATSEGRGLLDKLKGDKNAQ